MRYSSIKKYIYIVKFNDKWWIIYYLINNELKNILIFHMHVTPIWFVKHWKKVNTIWPSKINKKTEHDVISKFSLKSKSFSIKTPRGTFF